MQFVKSDFIVIVFAAIASVSLTCCVKQIDKGKLFTDLKNVYNNDSLFYAYNYIIAVSDKNCKGCVEQKISAFDSVDFYHGKVVVLLDTADETNYKLIKGRFKFIMMRQSVLDSFISSFYNYLLIKKDSIRILDIYSYGNNGDTLSIACFFNALK